MCPWWARRGRCCVSETRVWVETIPDCLGFYRLCVQSGDFQARVILGERQFEAFLAAARSAQLEMQVLRSRGDVSSE